jgi:uncharacterized membrane protein YhaH (DUF805 family)
LIRTHHEVGIQIGLIMRTRDPQVPVLPPANWYADPGGRHQYRYFDGTQWTDHVADGGRAGLDPLGLPPPSEQMLVTPPVVAQAEAEPAPVVAGPPSEQTPGLAIDLDRAVVAEAEVETAPAFVTELDVQQDEAPASEAATPHPEPVSAAATPVGDTLGSPAEGPGAPITMLSMDEAVRRCLRGYADFSGRAPRSEYWWFALAVNLALGVAWLAGTLVFGGIVSTPETAAGLGGVPYVLLSLALVLPILAAAVRRLHDTDRSGAMLLLALIPVAGPLILLVFFATPGTDGPNRYGDPVPPTGPSARLEATLFGALRIPLLYLLAGVATTVLFDLTRSWAEWGSYWGAWALMLLALGAFVAVLVVLRTVVSRIVLWLEVAAASVLLLAPWVPGAAEPWRDWPQLLQAPVMFPPYRLLFGAAWLAVLLVTVLGERRRTGTSV